MKHSVMWLWALTLFLWAGIARADEAALKTLLNDVKEIDAPGSTGALATYGSEAFPVVTGKSGPSQIPAVGATQARAGRIVAFAHDGYLNAESLNTLDTGNLMLSALRWVGNGKTRVGVWKNDSTLKWLQGKGVQATAISPENLNNTDVLVFNAHDLNENHLTPLRAFLARGGGLITAATGWGWEQITGKEISSDFTGNKLLAPFGMVWTSGTLNRTTTEGFSVTTPSPYLNGGRAFEALKAHLAGTKLLDKADLTQAAGTVSALATALPPDDTLLLPQLRQMATGAAGEVVPLARRPIRAEDGAARLLLTLQTTIEKTLPIEQIKPSPAGAVFPGDVPPNYKPVTQTVPVDLKVPDWHSTGLYAAPGARIKISLPVGDEKLGLGVRIGCHTDQLWHLDKWERSPDISRFWPLRAAETTVANPFGGLVYITVPRDKTGSVDVTIAGAHEAPRFVLGQTNVDEWKNRLRWLPGPWAEIETDRIIITVPSRSVRDMEDPRPIAELYVKAMDAIADLATIPHQRSRPERIVADQQISAGYMHSGYPIMTWLDVEKNSVDTKALQNNSWGHWHEIGHNHQIGDWTFGGTGEVTNNLFALYVWEKVIGKPRNEAHPALQPANMTKEWEKYTANGRRFSELQGNPFLFLQMYIQLENAFGWDTFKKVFAEYRTLKANERPKNDAEKRDQWMVRFSRAAGKNLGPFFQTWGVPTSQAARDSIKELPAWMPDSLKN